MYQKRLCVHFSVKLNIKYSVCHYYYAEFRLF